MLGNKITKIYKVSTIHIDDFQKFILKKYRWNGNNNHDILDGYHANNILKYKIVYIEVWCNGVITYGDETNLSYHNNLSIIDYDRKIKIKKLLK